MNNKPSKKIVLIVVISTVSMIVLILMGNIRRNNIVSFNNGLKEFTAASYGEILIEINSASLIISNSTDSHTTDYKQIYFDIQVDNDKNKRFEMLVNQSESYEDKEVVPLLRLYQKDDVAYINSPEVDDTYYMLDNSANKGAVNKVYNMLDTIEDTFLYDEEVPYQTSLPKSEKINFYSLYNDKLIGATSYSLDPDSVSNSYIYMSNGKVVGEKAHISESHSFLGITTSVSSTAEYDCTKWGNDITIDFPKDLEQAKSKDSKQFKEYINKINTSLLIESEE